MLVAGTLTSLGKSYARLWSSDFGRVLLPGLDSWLKNSEIRRHPYLHPVDASSGDQDARLGDRPAGRRIQLRNKKSWACSTPLHGRSTVSSAEGVVDIGMPLEACRNRRCSSNGQGAQCCAKNAYNGTGARHEVPVQQRPAKN
jgi:hypothetical protein